MKLNGINMKKANEYKYLGEYTGWSKKTAQSLWYHNFAIVHHRVKSLTSVM